MWSETRQLSGFSGIALKGVGNVEIIPSDEYKIVIHSNQDIITNIKTEIINEDLNISVIDKLPVWLVSFPKIEMKVYVKHLERLKVSGVGKLRCSEVFKTGKISVLNHGVGGVFVRLEAEEVNTHLKGVGEIELRGRADTHNVEISGTGKINAYNFKAKKVKINATGVGECVVYAVEKIEYKAGGIGRIKYRGNPELQGQLSALGGIQKIN